jgi:hypothetical protein
MYERCACVASLVDMLPAHSTGDYMCHKITNLFSNSKFEWYNNKIKNNIEKTKKLNYTSPATLLERRL